MIKPVKTILSASLMSAILVFSSISGAYASSDDFASMESQHHNKGNHMMKRMGRMLGLSDQQKVQIKALKDQAKEQNGPLRVSIKQFKEAEKLLLQAEIFDEQAYLALYASNQQNFTQMALAKAKAKHAFFNVLTAEQQEKFQKIMKQRKKKYKRN